jgi:hypothetical protein
LDLLDKFTSYYYTLQITVTHRLVFSVTVFTALLGNIFQQWTFLHSRALSHPRPTTYSSNSHLRTLVIKVKVTLRLMVSQSVSLGVKPHLGLMTRYLLLFDSYGLAFFFLWGALSDERAGLSFVRVIACISKSFVIM